MMNCDIFRKKLPDYLEGSLPKDMETALSNHMDKCEGCKDLYNTEVFLDNAFRDALKVDNIKFNSSRAEIIKNIDKNRYSKKITNKAFFYLKKNRIFISSCAALLAIFLITAPYLGKVINSKLTSRNLSVAEVKKPDLKYSKNSNSSVASNMGNSNVKDSTSSSKSDEKTATSIVNTKFVSKLNKVEYDTEPLTADSTEWTDSINSKLSASIVGKGPSMVEEGIAKIYVKDLKSKKKWAFDVPANKNSNQYSPKCIQWCDDQFAVLIAGLGYGTVTKGGNLYYVDMISGDVYPLYENDSPKQEIMSVEKSGNDLKVKFNVYEDDNMTKCHTEDGIIKDFDVTKPGMIEIHSESGTIKFVKLNTPIKK